MMRTRRDLGFTLAELLIACAIVAILAAIALPSYNAHIIKVRRTEATAGLYDFQTRMERYYSFNNTYVGATTTNVGAMTPTPGGYYTLSINTNSLTAPLTATTYMLQATPVAGTTQANDATCGNFTLTQTGALAISGTGTVAECWQR